MVLPRVEPLVVMMVLVSVNAMEFPRYPGSRASMKRVLVSVRRVE